MYHDFFLTLTKHSKFNPTFSKTNWQYKFVTVKSSDSNGYSIYLYLLSKLLYFKQLKPIRPF